LGLELLVGMSSLRFGDGSILEECRKCWLKVFQLGIEVVIGFDSLATVGFEKWLGLNLEAEDLNYAIIVGYNVVDSGSRFQNGIHNFRKLPRFELQHDLVDLKALILESHNFHSVFVIVAYTTDAALVAAQFMVKLTNF
jgi:hypothetical protein